MENLDWRDNLDLKVALQDYVRKRWKRIDIVSYMKRDFWMYHWSESTLKRRLKEFGIRYIDQEVSDLTIAGAVVEEIGGVGKDLGYRPMTQKLREVHGLNVPEKKVLEVMKVVDPDGIERRAFVGQPKRPKRKNAFVSSGSNLTWSLDGHDKLCGYQKSRYPLAIYGALDTFSGYVVFLKVGVTNNLPLMIGKYYIDTLCANRVHPVRLRVDCGTETGIMAKIHGSLIAKKYSLDDGFKVEDYVLKGPSTQNKIERWWKELHERCEQSFKDQLRNLTESGKYNQYSRLDRDILAFVYLPVIQRELDVFRTTVWNNKLGRKQRDKMLPHGVPANIYEFPGNFGDYQDHGMEVSDTDLDELTEIEELGPIFRGELNHFLRKDILEEFEKMFQNITGLEKVDELLVKDAPDVYWEMKEALTPMVDSVPHSPSSYPI